MKKENAGKMIPRRIENVRQTETVTEAGKHAGLNVMKFPDSEKLGAGGYRLTCARMILSRPFGSVEEMKKEIRFTEDEINVIMGIIEASKMGDIKVRRKEVDDV